MQNNSEEPLTIDNYFSDDANIDYMSFPFLRAFEQCEAATLAALKGEYTPTLNTRSKLIDRYVRCNFKETEQQQAFANKYRDRIFTKSGQLRADATRAREMIKSCLDDQLFRGKYLSGKRNVIVTGKINGCQWKAMIDSLNLEQKYFCELIPLPKIHQNISPESPQHDSNFIFDNNYQLKMAIYQELIKQTFNVECSPYIFAVSEEMPPDKLSVSFVSESAKSILRKSLVDLLPKQRRYQKVLMGEEEPHRCERCTYCHSTKEFNAFTDVSEIKW